MAGRIKIKKGLDIPLKGQPSDVITTDSATTLFAIYPDDFNGPTWKAVVKPGEAVNAGEPIFSDKESGEIKLVAPVKGVVKDIKRGERRHIEYISIEGNPDKAKIDNIDLSEKNNENILKILKETGLWAMMRQRPYDIVPENGVEPRDIFVTAFDSAPLAGDLIDSSNVGYIDKGIEILSSLTKGKVYVGISPTEKLESKFGEITVFEGPHPAGNVGTQIAAIKPVNKGETVWTLDIETVARMGRLFVTGELDFTTRVAVTGPAVTDPHFVKTTIGCELKTLLKGFINLEDEGLRIISGNVLTGIKTAPDGFLHYPYRQITVIEEGNEADEFMGWASVNPSKFSVKRSFPAFIRGLNKPFDFDARIKGGKRAMILSGEYDKVFPFDIYPEYLLKAIMSGDIDRMEKLGIYEVSPEDFALPEFVDTSKNELQKTVRDGLDTLRKELS